MYLLLIPCVALFVWNKRNRGGDALQTVTFKTICTTSIILTALAGLSSTSACSWGALFASGLVLGLVGDIVICRSDGFLAGMTWFALGHLCYIAALLQLTKRPLWAIPIFAILYGVVLWMTVRLKPQIGTLFIPVLVYTAVITSMVSLAATAALSINRGAVLLLAAILFATSDILLAVGKFVRASGMAQDLFGQYCYFFGQSLFAVSIYFL